MLEGMGEMGEKSNKYRQRFGLFSSPCKVLLPWGKWCGRKVVGLGEVISLQRWGPTMLSLGAKSGWVTQNQNAVIAEVNIGFKVNEIS